MVRTGVLRAWGDRLKHFIEVRLGNRGSAFLAGAMATAILGSGTATTLIVAGIAASGAIGTALGLAVLAVPLTTLVNWSRFRRIPSVPAGRLLVTGLLFALTWPALLALLRAFEPSF